MQTAAAAIRPLAVLGITAAFSAASIAAATALVLRLSLSQ